MENVYMQKKLLIALNIITVDPVVILLQDNESPFAEKTGNLPRFLIITMGYE